MDWRSKRKSPEWRSEGRLLSPSKRVQSRLQNWLLLCCLLRASDVKRSGRRAEQQQDETEAVMLSNLAIIFSTIIDRLTPPTTSSL